MVDLIKSLEEKVKNYTYRGLDWVTRLEGPLLFPKQRVIVLPDFYSKQGYAHTGVCNELMVQSFIDLSKEFPDLYSQGRIFRVKGADPVFFGLPSTTCRDSNGGVIGNLSQRSRGAHLFLAITNRRIMDNGKNLQGTQAKQALMYGNAILFDPSFGIVERVAESEYLIDEIWAPGFKSTSSANSAIFDNGHFGSPKQIVGISGGLVVSINLYYVEPNTTQNYTVTISYMTPGVDINHDVNIYARHLDYTAKHIEGLDVFLKHMRMICKTASFGDDLAKHQMSVTIW
ncbi:hypothetical protein HYV86_02515 [Candidatus Woesearchaeota archaeon]|nr:hypothetical protein [Candidatus Woesearchaeota archaeon]